MKSLPNIITLSRIPLTILLIIYKPFSMYFMIVYMLVGLSDVFDGYAARRLNAISAHGALFDSIADAFFMMVYIFIITPSLNLEHISLICIGIIFILRITTLIIGYIRFKRLTFIHTYSNKLTGLLLFMYPLLFRYDTSKYILYVVMLIASLSAIEELFIVLTSTSFDANQKSLFASLTRHE